MPTLNAKLSVVTSLALNLQMSFFEVFFWKKFDATKLLEVAKLVKPKLMTLFNVYQKSFCKYLDRKTRAKFLIGNS